MTSRFKSSSSSSSSSKSSGVQKKRQRDHVHFNRSFTEAIAATVYEPIVNVPMDYDIYLDSSGWHWLILVKGHMDKATFPFITFEVTTTNAYKELIPTMRVIQTTSIAEPHIIAASYIQQTLESIVRFSKAISKGRVEDVMLEFGGTDKTLKGTRTTTMADLCESAENIRLAMGTYSLRKRNCQHFCNNFLSAWELKTEETTFGPNTSDDVETIFSVREQDLEGCVGGERGT